MTNIIKKILGGILMEIVPIGIIVIMAVIYAVFLPEHWGKLTLITIAVVACFGGKFNERF
ncbi:hypothetical protein PUG81_22795 [Erwiniaceae bacterium L1_54_6]|jgi:Na+/H+-dicarboxylate symporter|nr:hypothetical protein [Erwiniaceae bacterium L1_54_6]